MNINKENYQSYFLDYMEGNLSKDEIDKLYSFVYQNPELIEEFECLDFFVVENDIEARFEEKQALKKINFSEDRITESNFELFIIAYYENDLDSSKRSELEKFLNNNKSFIPIFEAYKNTIISPEIFVLENKEQLKHFTQRKIRPLYYYLSAAASIAIIISMYFLLPNDSNTINYSQNISQDSVKVSSKENKTSINNNEIVQVASTDYSSTNETKQNNRNKTIYYNREILERASLIDINLDENPDNNPNLNTIENSEPVFVQKYTSKNEPIPIPLSSNNYNTVSEILVERVNNYLGTDIPKNSETKEKIRFWDVAEWGSKAINKIFDKKTAVNHQYNENLGK